MRNPRDGFYYRQRNADGHLKRDGRLEPDDRHVAARHPNAHADDRQHDDRAHDLLPAGDWLGYQPHGGGAPGYAPIIRYRRK